MGKKRIKTVILFFSLWLLVLPPVFHFIVSLSLQTGSIAVFLLGFLLLLGLPPFLITLVVTRWRKKVYGIWFSRKRIVFEVLNYFNFLILSSAVAFFEYPLYFWLRSGEFFQIHDPQIIAIIALIFGFLLASISFVLVEKITQKMQRNFKENRSVVLNIPARSAKQIILEALEKQNISYSRPDGLFNANEGQKFVELESGIQIGVIPHFRRTVILISRIPKNDNLEPEIEKEILRLMNLHQKTS